MIYAMTKVMMCYDKVISEFTEIVLHDHKYLS